MDFASCLADGRSVLMEGALGERLKREYRLRFDKHVAMAGLVYEARGRAALIGLWSEYADIAQRHGLPLLATTPTRRANRERVSASRYGRSIIGDNVSLLRGLQERSSAEVLVGGLMGCRGDAYRATDVLPAGEARSFHAWQADLFAEAGADFLYAGIMPALSEAIGMAQAMGDSGLPYIISFMIRGSGRLLDGATIHHAIRTIDACGAVPPECYMTNCVHPAVLHEALSQPFNSTELVRERFAGIQANASRLAPEELDDASDLGSSDAGLLASDMIRLRQDRKLRIFGGCCGTDGTHLEEIARRLAQPSWPNVPERPATSADGGPPSGSCARSDRRPGLRRNDQQDDDRDQRKEDRQDDPEEGTAPLACGEQEREVDEERPQDNGDDPPEERPERGRHNEPQHAHPPHRTS